MKEYYYIAKIKPRGCSPRYVGDGIISAESVKEAKELVSHARGVPKSRVSVRLHISSKA